MQPVVRTERLEKRFIGVEAVAGVTLEVPPGSIFALIGPSGAGKSTTLKLLLKLLRPSRGRAEVLGEDSRRIGPAQLRRIGYVSEEQRLPEWMRVGYFLDYCSAFYPTWDHAQARSLTEAFDLPAGRRIRELSRGMRVKLAFTAALAYRPALLLLDEPFSGLDVLVREELAESILTRTPEMTVLLVSHDLADIESFASHIAYMDAGRVRFTQEAGELSARFRQVEITLEQPLPHLPPLPSHWLNAEHSGAAVRFTDSHFDRTRTETDIQARFPAIKAAAYEPMTLRSIFVALARAAKSGGVQ